MNTLTTEQPLKFVETLRKEAAMEPDTVATGEVTKETQIIAIYGKGGIGKSFTLANLSYMMAQQGKKVLLIGCDPKSDTTSLLFGGKACPTIIETSSRLKLAGQAVSIGDVCFKRDGVFAMELGGPVHGTDFTITKQAGYRHFAEHLPAELPIHVGGAVQPFAPAQAGKGQGGEGLGLAPVLAG
jgi:hypothetical protein